MADTSKPDKTTERLERLVVKRNGFYEVLKLSPTTEQSPLPVYNRNAWEIHGKKYNHKQFESFIRWELSKEEKKLPEQPLIIYFDSPEIGMEAAEIAAAYKKNEANRTERRQKQQA